MLTDIQKLRYELLKATNYSLVEAEKYYDFIIKPEIECKSNNELTDGIYLMYYKTPVAYKGQKLSENEKNGCTGVGIKFGGKSLVAWTAKQPQTIYGTFLTWVSLMMNTYPVWANCILFWHTLPRLTLHWKP